MKLRVLLVDDDDAVRGVLGEFLRHEGYEVVACASAGSGRDAILAEGASFDLAILDWSLPDLSGRELVLLAQEVLPECSILVSTGLAESVVSRRLTGPGIRGVLRKPYSLRELRTVVREALHGPRGEI